MAADIHLARMAKVLVDYSAEIKEKDKVMIQGTVLAAPLIEALYKELIVKGAYPELLLLMDNIETIFYTYAQDHQLTYVSPFRKYYVENVDIIISIIADYNTKCLTAVPPAKIAQRAKANQEINTTIFERTYQGQMKWTLTLFPTHALAQEASMSLMEYEEFVYKACFLDKEDPVAAWRELSRNQEKVVSFLQGKSELHILGEDTDLTVSVKGRTWVNSDGRRNFPSGEVFTSPVETSAEGRIRFTYPGIYMGKEVEDITLTFEKGQAVEASAQKGDDLLQEMLNTDEGARRLGEVAIGTNYGITQFTKNILFDEKIGGTMHLAVGRSLPDAGGQNNSAIHWDLIKDMKRDSQIYADGELFYENGVFVF